MAGVGYQDAGSPAHRLDVEGLLLRAALLAGHGRDARALACRLAAATAVGRGKSCLEAGAPIQFTIDAPGPAGLRVGLRLAGRLTGAALEGLVPAAAAAVLVRTLGTLASVDPTSLGTWLFWTTTRQSIFVDLRDPSPTAALERLQRVLTPAQRERLARLRPAPNDARPWALRCEVDGDAIARLHVHWLIARHVAPRNVAEAIVPGSWGIATDVLGHLVRRPEASGRWVVATPLDERSEPALRIGNSGWLLVPEDDRKHRSIGELMAALGGPRDHAEALWSLCRGAAAPGWRVGRACELKIGGGASDGVRARLFFAPDVYEWTTAGTSSSAPESASMAPSAADPSTA